MSWQHFYSDPDLSDGFGSTSGDRANPHFGLDFDHPADTPIPSYVTGTVVVNEWSKALGNVLEVETPAGRFIGSRHMLHASPFAVGATVKIGQDVGFVGNTGSASRGNHLCTTNSSRKGGVFGTAYCVDPWPFIQAAIADSAPAGGNIIPFTPTSGDDDMATLELVQTAGGKEGIFYSVNRLHRYPVPDPTTLKDYQFFITEQKKAGNVNAKPDVQIVKNLSAFGAIVR